MNGDDVWDDERTVQVLNSGYYRISLPKEYVERYFPINPEQKEDIPEEDRLANIKQTGEYVVYRPAQLDEEGQATLNLEHLDVDAISDPNHPQHDYTSHLIEKTIQSILISSVSQVKLQLPEKLDLEKNKNAKRGLKNVVEPFRETPGITIDFDGEEIRIDHTVEFAEYIESVKEFVDRHLVDPLDPDFQFGDFDDIEDRADVQETRRDRDWALATRQTGQALMNLERPEFHTHIANLYISKYCEMLVDITKRIVSVLSYIEEHYSGQDSPAEWVKQVLYILINDEYFRASEDLPTPESFGDHIRQTAIGEHDPRTVYHREFDIYDKRTDYLELVRYRWGFSKKKKDVDDEIKDIFPTAEEEIFEGYSPRKQRDLGVAVGELFTLAERLIRFPRSIALVKLTANHVDSVQPKPSNFS